MSKEHRATENIKCNDRTNYQLPANIPQKVLDISLCEPTTHAISTPIAHYNHGNINNFGFSSNIDRSPNEPLKDRFYKDSTKTNDATVTVEEMYKLLSLQSKNMQQNENLIKTDSPIPMPLMRPQQNEISLNDIYQLILKNQSSNENGRKKVVDEPTHQVDTVSRTDAEPSVKDLFNIIVKQQEQLVNMQKQIQSILVNNQNMAALPNRMTTYNELNAPPSPTSVMTSLEINVQQYSNNNKMTPTNEYILNTNQKNEKLVENKENTQCSCSCKKAMTTIPNSDELDTNSDESNELQNDEQFKAGWLFYGNILNQVNDVLENSPPVGQRKSQMNQRQSSPPIHNPIEGPPSCTSNEQNRFITPNIRSAQFKQIGFQFDDVNISATAER